MMWNYVEWMLGARDDDGHKKGVDVCLETRGARIHALLDGVVPA